MQMKKILISGCLLGMPVRYDGKSKPLNSPLILKWQKENRLVAVCPECLGGLKIPRNPAEIIGNKVITDNNIDVTDNYYEGALKTLEIAKKNNVCCCILKEFSPSCGSHFINNGTFTKTRINGMGITAKLLTENGFKVFSENELLKVEEND